MSSNEQEVDGDMVINNCYHQVDAEIKWVAYMARLEPGNAGTWLQWVNIVIFIMCVSL